MKLPNELVNRLEALEQRFQRWQCLRLLLMENEAILTLHGRTFTFPREPGESDDAFEARLIDWARKNTPRSISKSSLMPIVRRFY
jgi:hypothetical protein